MNEAAHEGSIDYAAGMVENMIITVRFLGNDMMSVKEFVYNIWDILRRELIGKGAVRIRKY